MEGQLRKFIFSGIAVLGIMLIIVGMIDIYFVASSANWKQTTLHIDNVKITHIAETENYDLLIFYSYTAEGKNFSNSGSDGLYYNTYGSTTDAMNAAEFLNGSSIPIYYNPNNPEQFSFNKGLDLFSITPVVVGVVILLPAIIKLRETTPQHI